MFGANAPGVAMVAAALLDVRGLPLLPRRLRNVPYISAPTVKMLSLQGNRRRDSGLALRRNNVFYNFLRKSLAPGGMRCYEQKVNNGFAPAPAD
jgi:hypothetical protein